MSGTGGFTAVCAVMWVQPTILAPASGFSPWALFLKEISADMSVEEQNEHRVREAERTQRSRGVLLETRMTDPSEY